MTKTKSTITEALSELKLIEKKIAKKQETILANTIRAEHVKDPFESEGGGEKYINAELQSVKDLRNRFVKIRAAIAKANAETFITIGTISKSVAEWLIYKREISTGEGKFHQELYNKTKGMLDSAIARPQAFTNAENKPDIVRLVSNVNIASLLKENEEIADALEKLDGQLSLKNATVVIEY